MVAHNRRLRPSRCDSDYYMLTALRNKLSSIIYSLFNSSSQLKLLDYGCGDVPYKILFKDYICQYVAADILGNPCADIVLGTNGEIPSEDETFDVVISIQVLEHVPSPNKYLSEAKRVLKKGGTLILSTHGWWTHHPFPNDYWRWTREGLHKVLKDNGYRIIEYDWIIGLLAYTYQLRIQCLKGLLEDKGFIASKILSTASFIYQKLMFLADRITPNEIASNNASIYIFVVKKDQ